MNPQTIRRVLAFTVVLALALGTGACPKPASTDNPKPATQTNSSHAQPAAKGERFLIKFDRPLKVGLKYKVVAKGTVDKKTTLNGKILSGQNDTFKVIYDYEGVVTVKAVHTSGKATMVEVTIVKLRTTTGGVAKDLLPSGTVVLAKTEGNKEKFTVEHDPNGYLYNSQRLAKVLKYVISLFDGDTTSTDDVFGPGGLKRVGDSWKLNGAKLLASLKTKFKFKDAVLWPKPSDVTGKVTFVAAKKVDGLHVLEIKTQTRLNNLVLKIGGVATKSGHLETNTSGWLPRDPKVLINDFRILSTKIFSAGDVTVGSRTPLNIVVNYTHKDRRSRTLIK